MSVMPHRLASRPTIGRDVSNDNIRTAHLKCDRCRTRVTLTGIVASAGVETRWFSCAHCGANKSIRIEAPVAAPVIVRRERI